MSNLNSLWNFKESFKKRMEDRDKEYKDYINNKNVKEVTNKKIDESGQTVLNGSINLDDEPNFTPDPEDTIDTNINSDCTIRDLELGDKLELSNGDIVYFIKMLSPKSIWVTSNEYDRYNDKAEGQVIYTTLNALFDVQEDSSQNVKEDVVTGTTNTVSVSNLTNIMYEALLKWQKQGKASDIEKVNKGQLTKIFPEFKNYLEPYNKSESYIYNAPDSGNQKMILVNTGSQVVNLSISIDQTNTWKGENFYKMFTESEQSNVNENYKSVAQEIMNQISTGGLNSIRAYFGANQFVAGENQKKSEADKAKLTGEWAKDKFYTKGNLGYLQFKASGSKLKRGAKVKIALNGLDLYDVTVYKMLNIKALDRLNNPDKDDFQIVKQVENVPADTLFDVLKNILG